MPNKTWSEKPVKTFRRIKKIVTRRVIGTRSAVLEGRTSGSFEQLSYTRTMQPSDQNRSSANAPAVRTQSLDGIHQLQTSGTPGTVPRQSHTPVTSPGALESMETPLSRSTHLNHLVGISIANMTTGLNQVEERIAAYESLSDTESHWTIIFKQNFRDINTDLGKLKTAAKNKGLVDTLSRIYHLNSRLDTHFRTLQDRARNCTSNSAQVVDPQAGPTDTTLRASAQNHQDQTNTPRRTGDPSQVDIEDVPDEDDDDEGISVAAMVHRFETPPPPYRNNTNLSQVRSNSNGQETLRPEDEIVTDDRYQVSDLVTADANDQGIPAGNDDQGGAPSSVSGQPPNSSIPEIAQGVFDEILRSDKLRLTILEVANAAIDTKLDKDTSARQDHEARITTLETLRVRNRDVKDIREIASSAVEQISTLSGVQSNAQEFNKSLFTGLTQDLSKLESAQGSLVREYRESNLSLSNQVKELRAEVSVLRELISSHRCPSEPPRTRFSNEVTTSSERIEGRTISVHSTNIGGGGDNNRDPSPRGRRERDARNQDIPGRERTHIHSPVRSRRNMSPTGRQQVSPLREQIRSPAVERHRHQSPGRRNDASPSYERYDSPSTGRVSRGSHRSSGTQFSDRAKERAEIRMDQLVDSLSELIDHNPVRNFSTKDEIGTLKNTIVPQIEDDRSELLKIVDKYERFPNYNADKLMSVDSSLNEVKEWCKEFRIAYEKLDGNTKPLDGGVLYKSIGIFSENSDISIFEFLKRFEVGACNGRGSKSDRSLLLFEKHLEQKIQEKMYDFRNDYDGLINKLKRLYGKPLRMCETILKTVSSDPPGTNSSYAVVSDHMRTFECSMKKIDALWLIPGVDTCQLEEALYSESFVKSIIERVPPLKHDDIMLSLNKAGCDLHSIRGRLAFNTLREWIREFAFMAEAKSKTCTTKGSSRSRDKERQALTHNTGVNRNSIVPVQKDGERTKTHPSGSDNRRNAQNSDSNRRSNPPENFTRIEKRCPLKDHQKSPHSILNCKTFLELSPADKRSKSYGATCYTCLGPYRPCKRACQGNVPPSLLCHECGEGQTNPRLPLIIMCPDHRHKENLDEDVVKVELSQYFPEMQFQCNERALLGLN